MEAEDYEWAIGIIEAAADAAEAAQSGSITTEKLEAYTRSLGRARAVIQRLRPESMGATNGGALVVATRLRVLAEELRILPDIERRLGPSGPQLAAARLHPTVWGACVSLWGTKHYRQAVISAAQAVNALLQSALQRRDISERDAVAQAFSTEAPSSDSPRLRFPDTSKTREPATWKNRHEGARFLGMGLFSGVRNVLAHEDPSTEVGGDEALEYLAAFSAFARWIDQAERVESGD